MCFPHCLHVSGSAISIASLDMAKAFDKVNYYVVFKGHLYPLLTGWHMKAIVQVYWEQCMSKLTKLRT